jgi:hypothetical protein
MLTDGVLLPSAIQRVLSVDEDSEDGEPLFLVECEGGSHHILARTELEDAAPGVYLAFLGAVNPFHRASGEM